MDVRTSPLVDTRVSVFRCVSHGMPPRLSARKFFFWSLRPFSVSSVMYFYNQKFFLGLVSEKGAP